MSVSFPRRRPGFLLLEVILGITVFGLFISAVGLTLLHGQQNTVVAGDRVRAMHVARRMIEASRAIRDGSFASLTAGAHGVAIGPAGTWVFSGTQSVFTGTYIASVSVTQLAADWVSLAANVKWKHGFNRSGSIVLQSELTDWRTIRRTGDWSSVTEEGGYAPGGNVLFNAVAVSGDYAFVGSETSGGGAGLYVLDISNTASPSRVASSFSLGAAGKSVVVKGKTLYVLTDDPAHEIQAYDISSPATLSAAHRKTTYNLGGSALGNSIALDGDVLYLTAMEHSSFGELHSFDISSSGAIRPIASLNSAATFNAVSILGTGAYVGTSDAAAEMRTVAVSGSGSLRFVGTDYNITSSEITRSLLVSGTSALMGRQRGSIQEFVLFDLANGGGSPPPSPGPWYHEGSGSIVGLGLDPTGCYAFLGADSSPKMFQVVQIRDKSLPELASVNSTTGPSRGLFYDVVRDRVFIPTRTSLLIFKPGAAPGPCA